MKKIEVPAQKLWGALRRGVQQAGSQFVQVDADQFVEQNRVLVAAKFALEVFHYLSRSRELSGRWPEIAARNAVETDPGICHSHDFCDANVFMAKALEDVTGLDEEAYITEEETPLSGACNRLFNEAWDVAKEHFFGRIHLAADVVRQHERFDAVVLDGEIKAPPGEADLKRIALEMEDYLHAIRIEDLDGSEPQLGELLAEAHLLLGIGQPVSQAHVAVDRPRG